MSVFDLEAEVLFAAAGAVAVESLIASEDDEVIIVFEFETKRFFDVFEKP